MKNIGGVEFGSIVVVRILTAKRGQFRAVSFPVFIRLVHGVGLLSSCIVGVLRALMLGGVSSSWLHLFCSSCVSVRGSQLRLLCGTIRATTLPLGVLVVVGREGLCVSFLPGGVSAVIAICYAE